MPQACNRQTALQKINHERVQNAKQNDTGEETQCEQAMHLDVQNNRTISWCTFSLSIACMPQHQITVTDSLG